MDHEILDLSSINQVGKKKFNEFKKMKVSLMDIFILRIFMYCK